MPKSFLVVLPDPIVCLDVEGILRDAYPEADIRIHRTPKTLQWSQIDGVGCLVLAGSAADAGLEPVLVQADEAGVPIVYIGHVPLGSHRGPVIRVPFTTGTLLRGLHDLISSRGATRP